MKKINKEEKVDIYLITTGDKGDEDYELSIRDKSGNSYYMGICRSSFTDNGNICIFRDDDYDEDDDDKDERIRKIVREIMNNGTAE